MQLVSETLEDFKIERFGAEAGRRLSEAIEQDKKDKKVNEAVAMLTISTILAAPVFLKLLGTLIKKGSKLFGWKGGENGGEKLAKFAHKMEEKFKQPINWVLKKAGVKDEDQRKKWSTGIFALIIILLGVYSGLETVHAFKAANIPTSTAEGLLTSLKATETGETLVAAVKAAGVKTMAKLA